MDLNRSSDIEGSAEEKRRMNEEREVRRQERRQRALDMVSESHQWFGEDPETTAEIKRKAKAAGIEGDWYLDKGVKSEVAAMPLSSLRSSVADFKPRSPVFTPTKRIEALPSSRYLDNRNYRARAWNNDSKSDTGTSHVYRRSSETTIARIPELGVTKNIPDKICWQPPTSLQKTTAGDQGKWRKCEPDHSSRWQRRSGFSTNQPPVCVGSGAKVSWQGGSARVSGQLPRIPEQGTKYKRPGACGKPIGQSEVGTRERQCNNFQGPFAKANQPPRNTVRPSEYIRWQQPLGRPNPSDALMSISESCPSKTNEVSPHEPGEKRETEMVENKPPSEKKNEPRPLPSESLMDILESLDFEITPSVNPTATETTGLPQTSTGHHNQPRPGFPQASTLSPLRPPIEEEVNILRVYDEEEDSIDLDSLFSNQASPVTTLPIPGAPLHSTLPPGGSRSGETNHATAPVIPTTAPSENSAEVSQTADGNTRALPKKGGFCRFRGQVKKALSRLRQQMGLLCCGSSVSAA